MSTSTSNQTFKQKAYQQFKEFLLIALYLWLVFGLLELHKSMILAEHHIDFAYHGFALINAFALAKVMLVARLSVANSASGPEFLSLLSLIPS